MRRANETQVGGTHYRTQFQHWDLAAECELGYFEGQITKYVTRHRFKKGEEDALKAQHFLVKLLELAQAGKAPQSAGITTDRMEEFVLVNKLLDTEGVVLYAVINWGDQSALRHALLTLNGVIDAVYTGEADASYVNQG